MTLDFIERAKEFLRRRATAYRMALHPAHNAYADEVLRDLAKFCRAHASTGHADPYMAARLDGRREVWLRIQSHLNLSTEELWKLHGGPTQPRE